MCAKNLCSLYIWLFFLHPFMKRRASLNLIRSLGSPRAYMVRLVPENRNMSASRSSSLFSLETNDNRGFPAQLVRYSPRGRSIHSERDPLTANPSFQKKTGKIFRATKEKPPEVLLSFRCFNPQHLKAAYRKCFLEIHSEKTPYFFPKPNAIS